MIYPASATSGITFSITNNSVVPYLMQSRVLNPGSGDVVQTDTPAPFIALPPLQRIEPGEKLTLRIRLMNAYLRQDRESLFILALKAIPSRQETSDLSGTLMVATQNNLKLFYRPASLPAYRTEEVAERLRFHRQGQQLVVDNPTPYWVTFSSLNLGGRMVTTTQMVPPSARQVYPLDKNNDGHELTWQLIDDHGQPTPARRQRLPSE
ncbi:TPA: molecular chaperone [Enterobacter cloacae]|nr:molecular chaperone [Enterobacter cloacae]